MTGASLRRTLLLAALAIGALPPAAAAESHGHATHHAHAAGPGVAGTPAATPAPALAAAAAPDAAPECPAGGDCASLIHCAVSGALAPASPGFPSPRPRSVPAARIPPGQVTTDAPSPPVPPPVADR